MTPLLPKGSRVAIVAPSGICTPERLAGGLQILRDAGYTLLIPDPLEQPHRYLAGSDAHRLAQLRTALTRPDVDAVWASRGGFGVTRLLPELPWSTLPKRLILGFSDLTPLLYGLNERVGSPALHAPVVHSLSSTSEAARAHLFSQLQGDGRAALSGTSWSPGVARGRLIGGNLAMLAATLGTAWAPRADGAILFLEDVGETPYRVDRLLTQLHHAGVLSRAAGIALGSWSGCAAPEGATWSLSDVLRDHLLPLGVPVVAGLPFGHTEENFALPVGRMATLGEDLLAW